MQAVAWPAALYLAGYDAGRLRGAAAQAARMGRRLLRADATASAVLGMKKSALCRGRRLEKLLAAQTGERALGLCERQGVFLCPAARSGHVVAFARAERVAGGDDCDAASRAAFAARAALARPPFVSAMEWMGSPLLPLDDLPLDCRLLPPWGAQRVLVVAPQSALRHQPDALEQASGFFVPCARELGENVGVFRIPLPETLGALSLDRILPAMDVGREAAEQGMEAALERIGMPLCRVLPFRRKLHRTVRSTVAFLPVAADHGFQRGGVCPGGNALPGVVSPVPVQAGDIAGRGACRAGRWPDGGRASPARHKCRP